MNIEAKEITALMGILEKMRENGSDGNFSFSYENGNEEIKVSNINSNSVRLEFNGINEIDCSGIRIVENTDDECVEKVKNGIKDSNIFENCEFENDIVKAAEGMHRGGELKTDLQTFGSSGVSNEIIFSAINNDLSIIGKEFGEGFKNASLSLLRCTKDHIVTTTDFKKDELRFEGEPSSESKFADKSYGLEEEEKDNGNEEASSQSDGESTDGDAGDQSEKIQTKAEIIDEEVKTVISEKSEKLYEIFNNIRNEGKIRIRSGKSNKILVGFSDAFKEAFDEKLGDDIDKIVKERGLNVGDDKEKLEDKIRAEFKKAVEDADGRIFGHEIKISETEKKREKIKEDLGKFEMDKELKGIIVDSYLGDEGIGFYDENGNIKDIEDIKAILRERVQSDLESEYGFGEKYTEKIEEIRNGKGAYSKIKKILDLIGLE